MSFSEICSFSSYLLMGRTDCHSCVPRRHIWQVKCSVRLQESLASISLLNTTGKGIYIYCERQNLRNIGSLLIFLPFILARYK